MCYLRITVKKKAILIVPIYNWLYFNLHPCRFSIRNDSFPTKQKCTPWPSRGCIVSKLESLANRKRRRCLRLRRFSILRTISLNPIWHQFDINWKNLLIPCWFQYMQEQLRLGAKNGTVHYVISRYWIYYIVSTQQLNTNADTKKSHHFRREKCKVFGSDSPKSLHL